MNRGRPNLKKLLEKVNSEISVFHKETGGFPSSLEANEIWKDIWLEETHHSTALEGNTLNSREIYKLVEQEIVSGNKEIRHYLEVQGYSNAARWVYEQAVESFKQQDRIVTVQHISHIHNLLMGPVWTSYPPATGDKPGQFRTGAAPRIKGSSLKLPPSGDVPDLINELVVRINSDSVNFYVCEWAAVIHAEFEKIHPFNDGNGRTGRLLMNYILIVNGYPPAIILKSQRPKYLRALERAQGKNFDYTMLAELVGRAVRDNLNKLMLPKLSGEEDLVPLSTLAESIPYQSSYLRRLAQEGKLKAVKEGNLWLSSRRWLQDYIDSRSSRGRRIDKAK
ncbi:Fic family protein [Phosphitispora fastidiosa]|uniref:Fic family protein n=1 Tax=Phosphitispora fastidiosa TaxID=2837202 RepID=UPI001E5691AB|nr:Fic family protein [Phosphitispora fastidiosa]MBU7007252.1 Fic family protein [Phosphitispora fastidiosa]